MRQVELAAYLARIGLPAPPAADAAGLAAAQRAHRLAIPFENLDIPLGRGIDLSPGALFDKLVTRRRGGYCFEQNALFLDALTTLGFMARPLLARVWLGVSDVPGKTHTFNLVTIDGVEWIADAGFGGSYTPPLPLAEGAEAATPDGAAHRLRRDPEHGWMLERHGDATLTDGRSGGEGWLPQYSFITAPAWPADLALSNHYTATVPGGRFTSLAIVSLALPNGFASLTNRAYRRRTLSDAVEGEITSAKMLRLRLGLVFGIEQSADEAERLFAFAGA